MADETPHRVTIEVPPDQVDLAVDAVWCTDPLAVAEEQVGEVVRLAAGYADAALAHTAARALTGWSPTIDAEDGTAWVEHWRAGATPHRAGSFRVRLPEHAPATDAGELVELVIEPGTTFGFGHPSTLLALELLEPVPCEGLVIADVGSGSGVLAVAAARLGAAVHAVDVDPQAVAATVDNAGRNDVRVDARLGSVAELAHDAYDLALVNVTAGIHRAVLPALRDRLARRSQVILSGLLDHQEPVVTPLLPAHHVRDRRQGDGWLALALES